MAGNLTMQRCGTQTEAAIELRVLSLDPSRDGFHFGLGLRERRARFQSHHHIQVSRARRKHASRQRIAGQRYPDLSISGKSGEDKTRRHNADHRVTLPVERHRLAKDLRVPGPSALPESVADDRHTSGADLILLRQKGAPERWFDAQN